MKKLFSLNDIDTIITQDIMPLLATKRVLLLQGPLGAGKTTFVRALLGRLGVAATIVSPTFSYVQTYHDRAGRTIHHFDLYRIQELQSFFALGLDELALDQDALIVVEWPQIVEQWLLQSERGSQVQKMIFSYSEDIAETRLLEI